MSLAGTEYFWNKAMKIAPVKEAIYGANRNNLRSTVAEYAGVSYTVSTGAVRKSNASNARADVAAAAMLLTVNHDDFIKYLWSFQDSDFDGYRAMVGDSWRILVNSQRNKHHDWWQWRNYVSIRNGMGMRLIFLQFFGDPVAFENDFAMFILGAD